MTIRLLGHTAGTVVLATLATLTVARTAGAQEPARLAFGYQCDDRFGLRNEGRTAVDVDYEVVGADESGRVHLEPDQTVDIVPHELGDVQISVGGQVVATAQRGNIACQQQQVIVRPMYEPRSVTVVAPYYRPMPVFYSPVVSAVYRSPAIRVGIGFGYPVFPSRVFVRGGYLPRGYYANPWGRPGVRGGRDDRRDGGRDSWRGNDRGGERGGNRGGDRGGDRGNNRGNGGGNTGRTAKERSR